MGDTRNKATLDSHCLPGGSWQQVGLCLHHCSGSISTEQLWSLVLVLAWPEEHLLPLHMHLLLAEEKENKLNINPSVNGGVRWENDQGSYSNSGNSVESTWMTWESSVFGSVTGYDSHGIFPLLGRL